MSDFRRCLCVISIGVLSLSSSAFAQSPHPAASGATHPVSAAEINSRLADMEKALTKASAEGHVAGFSLVVVKDGKPIYMKGIGMKDVESKAKVTPDTLFAIGSSSKAFTAVTMMMCVDEGKLVLSDPPRKYLPYFKLQDPDADAKMTISDLMCHRSGLARTDLAWATGMLTSDEIIRVAGQAKAAAKFGEKFQYQNVMFLTAGQIVGVVEKKPWTNVVADRIFKPLGMPRTETSIATMQSDPDHSLGYRWDEDSKAFVHLPMRNLVAIAPAGAINSSARDMSRWVEFMLNRGVWNGKRLIAEKSFDELFKKHMSVGGAINYGYGWFLRNWNGHAVMEHGGNIDGFSAQVALMPDQHLGFALLTNANATAFAPASIETVFDSLLGSHKKPITAAVTPATDPAAEVGVYRLEAASLDVTVAYNEKDMSLTLTVPGQPTYKLESEGGRKYKLAGLSGFSATFRPSKSDPTEAELLMTQPQGNFVAIRGGKPRTEAAETYTGPLKDLIGTYENEQPHAEFTVAAKSGNVCFIVPGQPPYPLKPNAKDVYRLGTLPEAFGVTVRRDSAGKVIGMELKQPQGNLQLKRESDSAPTISAAELMAKVVAAAGGESNLRKHHSLMQVVSSNLANEGVLAETVEYSEASGGGGKTTTYFALGKRIAISREYFDGTAGGAESTLSPDKPYGQKEVAAARYEADLYDPADWEQVYSSVVVKRTAKVGEEPVYVIQKTPKAKGLEPVTDYISTKNFLVLKRERFVVTDVGTLPVAETFEDYRDVDGVKIAFKHSVDMRGATAVDTTTSAEFDLPVPPGTFIKSPKKLALERP